MSPLKHVSDVKIQEQDCFVRLPDTAMHAVAAYLKPQDKSQWASVNQYNRQRINHGNIASERRDAILNQAWIRKHRALTKTLMAYDYVTVWLRVACLLYSTVHVLTWCGAPSGRCDYVDLQQSRAGRTTLAMVQVSIWAWWLNMLLGCYLAVGKDPQTNVRWASHDRRRIHHQSLWVDQQLAVWWPSGAHSSMALMNELWSVFTAVRNKTSLMNRPRPFRHGFSIEAFISLLLLIGTVVYHLVASLEWVGTHVYPVLLVVVPPLVDLVLDLACIPMLLCLIPLAWAIPFLTAVRHSVRDTAWSMSQAIVQPVVAVYISLNTILLQLALYVYHELTPDWMIVIVLPMTTVACMAWALRSLSRFIANN